MRPPCYYLLEEIVILGVIYRSLVWMVCNTAAPAAPAGPRGIRGLSPERGTHEGPAGQGCPAGSNNMADELQS